MSRDALGRALLLGAGFAAMAGLFFTCFERVEEVEPAGYSREAREHPYLALERLLARLAHPVTRLDTLADLETLPAPDATLWLLVDRSSLPAQRTQELLDWVGSGGHLVVASQRPTGGAAADDPLLERLGLAPIAIDEVEDEAEESSSGSDEAERSEEEGASPVEVAAEFGSDADEEAYEDVPPAIAIWPGTTRPLSVAFDDRFGWDAPPELALWQVPGPSGAHLVMLAHGEGRITALSDAAWLRNPRIAEADHAELALRLARVNGERPPSWIVRSAEWPRLPALAVRHATPVLVAGAVLLVAWIGRASRRFGPIEAAPPPERRRWIEHLDAVGAYHWRTDGGRQLLIGLREQVRKRLEGRRPAWARAPEASLALHLAELTDLSPDQVASALRSAPPRSESAFVTTIAHLERIRAAL